MIERSVMYGVAAVVVLSMLAAVLPSVAPSLAVLGLLALVARVVWFYTR